MKTISTTLEEEESFIKVFVLPALVERLLFLHKSKRRPQFLESIRSSNWLKPEYTVELSTKVSHSSLTKILQKLGSLKDVNVVSDSKYPSGATLGLMEAIEGADSDFGTLIFCIQGQLACRIGEYGLPRVIIAKDCDKVRRLLKAEGL